MALNHVLTILRESFGIDQLLVAVDKLLRDLVNRGGEVYVIKWWYNFDLQDCNTLIMLNYKISNHSCH